jgi:hypothetical protein
MTGVKGRTLGATVLAAVAFAAAGCGGGGGGSASSASDIVPPDALAFLTLNTSFGSSQDKSAADVLNKFPLKSKLISSLEQSATKSGVNFNSLKKSVGPEVDVAILDVDNKRVAVGFTQPKDEKAFDQALASAKKPLVHEKISGWTVFAETQPALDAVKNRSGKLADVPQYKDASASTPSSTDAVATAYVSQAGLRAKAKAPAGSAKAASLLGNAKWATAAATSHDNGVELELHASGVGGSGSPSASPLAAQIPSGVLAAISLQHPGNLLQKIGPASPTITKFVQSTLGVSVSDLANALSGDTILYVLPGAPIPELTLASKPADPKAAEATAVKVLAKLTKKAKPQPATLSGFLFHRLALGPIDLFYGVANGELIVTDSSNAIAELQSKKNKLSSDANFKGVKDAVQMPDANQGFVYLDVKDALPTVEAFAQLTNLKIPAPVDANLKPLRTVLIYGTHKGTNETLVAFAQANS